MFRYPLGMLPITKAENKCIAVAPRWAFGYRHHQFGPWALAQVAHMVNLALGDLRSPPPFFECETFHPSCLLS
ncbi:hypothetical protein NQZ68_011462 [Dissostichus eleginoides]|nr:hypothetical protein NQZ68_011462 [Dissostichus eleginoides]